MGEHPRGRDASGALHRRAIRRGAGLLFCTIALLADDVSALAQYIGQPTVFNGPIPGVPAPAGAGTPAPAGAEGEATIATAGPAWVLTPSLGLSETYTDNVNLAPSSQARSDLVTSISPSLNIVGQSAHVNLALTYDPQLLLFALGTSSPEVQQQLLGTAHVE